MTNGEKFKEVFKISQVDEGELYAFVWLPNHDAAEITIEWWNAEYEEPTTKNDSEHNLCDSCINYRCEFQSGIVRTKCAFYMPPVTPQETRWILVSEKLPEERLGVLVWCPTRKNIYCAYYEEKQWWIFGAYREKVTEEIVAWRPLPTKPYSEVKE